MARGRRGFMSKAVLVMLLLIGYALYLFGPPQWYFLQMKSLVREAAMTYKTSGSVQASRSTLLRRMTDARIPFYIADRDCQFRDLRQELRIECSWVAPILIEWASLDFSKPYEYKLSVDKSGVVEEY